MSNYFTWYFHVTGVHFNGFRTLEKVTKSPINDVVNPQWTVLEIAFSFKYIVWDLS